jgi:hypothetical protein
VADLGHWHYDTFEAKFRDPRLGTMLLTFDLDQSGRPRELVMPDLGVFSALASPPERQ